MPLVPFNHSTAEWQGRLGLLPVLPSFTVYGGQRPRVFCCVESCVMSTNASLFPYAATGLTALALVAALFAWPELARAADPAVPAPIPSTASGCLCPRNGTADARPSPAGVRIELDQNDEYAALESLQLALSEVADGQSYVWRRSHGRLSGIVKPLSSFKDTHGSVCRHAAVVLTGVAVTKRTEIVACRLPTGIWQLES